jgi:hypothetical protein
VDGVEVNTSGKFFLNLPEEVKGMDMQVPWGGSPVSGGTQCEKRDWSHGFSPRRDAFMNKPSFCWSSTPGPGCLCLQFPTC